MTAFEFTDDQQAIFDGVTKLCAQFDADYWRTTDETGDFPEAFVAAMAAGGWLGTVMPTALGGAGLGLTEAALMMQAVAQSGASHVLSTSLTHQQHIDGVTILDPFQATPQALGLAEQLAE